MSGHVVGRWTCPTGTGDGWARAPRMALDMSNGGVFRHPFLKLTNGPPIFAVVTTNLPTLNMKLITTLLSMVRHPRRNSLVRPPYLRRIRPDLGIGLKVII